MMNPWTLAALWVGSALIATGLGLRARVVSWAWLPDRASVSQASALA